MQEDLLMLIAGSVAVPLLQFLKQIFKLEGKPMMWFAVLISLALAVIISILSNNGGAAQIVANPMLILQGGGLIFGTAQVIYRGLQEKMDLSLPTK